MKPLERVMKNIQEYPINENEIEELGQCPVCSKQAYEIISNVLVSTNDSVVPVLQTAYCNNCGLVYRKRRPGLHWFEESWKARNKSENNSEIIDPKIEEWRYIRYKHLRDALSELKINNGKVLDIGSGPGTGLKPFIESGWDVLGLEPDPQRAKYSEEENQVPVIQDTFENAVIKDKSIGLVLLVHVLEHVHDLSFFISKIKKTIQENGYLYIEVPDINNFVRWDDAIYLEHMVNFNKANLYYFLKKSGFNPLYYCTPQTKINGVKHLGILSQLTNKASFETDSIKEIPDIKDIKSLYLKKFPKNIAEPLSKYPFPPLLDKEIIYKVNHISDICGLINSTVFNFILEDINKKQILLTQKEISHVTKVVEKNVGVIKGYSIKQLLLKIVKPQSWGTMINIILKRKSQTNMQNTVLPQWKFDPF